MTRDGHVLLLGAHYYGTLAAVRALGRAGISVVVADEDTRGVAMSSAYVHRRELHPPMTEPTQVVDWLIAWGNRYPGTVLYPTSDHLAWLFACDQERLAKAFLMVPTTEGTMLTLLDKWRLGRACAEVGIQTPAASVALDDAEKVGFPLLLKPRTQAMLAGGVKGIVVRSRQELASAAARFRELVQHSPYLLARDPALAGPMLQAYLPSAETSIVSVSGFVSADGTICARCARKVLQRPRKVGIGLCFESEPPDRALVEALAKLSSHVRYTGAFEAEFITTPDGPLLIDYNPRLYSQLAFDIARGINLPLLVWHQAMGHEREVGAAVARASEVSGDSKAAYCHQTMLSWMLLLQRMSGQMSRDEVAYWSNWRIRHGAELVDAVRDSEDPKPAWVDARNWALHFARHPRSFVRNYIQNR